MLSSDTAFLRSSDGAPASRRLSFRCRCVPLRRAGLLTAVAAEGYHLLGEALAAAYEADRSFLDLGIAYVRFGVGHPAHLEVMFQPALYDAGDTALARARARTASMLYGTAEADDEQLAAGVAAWSIVHGLVTLWRNGNIPSALGDDPEEIARRALVHLRPGPVSGHDGTRARRE